MLDRSLYIPVKVVSAYTMPAMSELWEWNCMGGACSGTREGRALVAVLWLRHRIMEHGDWRSLCGMLAYLESAASYAASSLLRVVYCARRLSFVGCRGCAVH